MLRYRLIFGILMIILFIGLMILGAWLDGTISADIPDKPVQGTILAVLIVFIAVFAQIEFSKFLKNFNIKTIPLLTSILTALLATSWYWRQFFENNIDFHLYYVLFITAFSVLILFLWQGKRFGYEGVFKNCGGNLLSVLYLGILSSFVLGIRIDFGIIHLLMFVFTVKFTDIGAYTFGKIWGKNKLSPVISPNKTWEGLVGGILAATLISVIFAITFNIIWWPLAVAFGVILAVSGQLGDLAESMLKRDAKIKDSAKSIPGFGGFLDLIDSPIATALLAYLFFLFTT